MKKPSGAAKRLTASGLIAVFILGGLLPLAADTASAFNQGEMATNDIYTGWIGGGNPTDNWNFWESVGSYVAVMMRPVTDYDLRIFNAVNGGGAIVSTSSTPGPSPELCIWNGHGAGGANHDSAQVFNSGPGAPGNNYDIEYEIGSTISVNSPVAGSFSWWNMLTIYDVYLTAGVTYTFKFNSINNNNADYRFNVFRPVAGAWNSIANSLGNGGYNPGNGYWSCQVAPGASGWYGVAVMQYNGINTNYNFVVGAPDLTISGTAISPSPVVMNGVNVIPQNKPYNIVATVYNQGYGDAGQFTVASYMDSVFWNSANLGGLSSRSSTQASMSYNTALTDTHSLIVLADSGSAVAEDGPSGTLTAESNNLGSTRYDCIAEARTAYSNDNDDTVPSSMGYTYYYYAYYFNAGDSQTFALWNPSASTDFDMYLYSPAGALVATAASAGYPERFSYYSAAGGYHYIYVIRAGGAGSKFTFSVDNADPTVQIVQPGDGDYLRGTLNEMRLNCADQGSGITGSAANPQYSVDGGAWANLSYDPQAGYNYTANLNTSLFIDGNHTLEFQVTDNAGNSATTSTKVVVDNTAPSACSLFDPVANQYVEGSLTVKVSAADAIGMASVNLNFGGNLAGLGDQSAGYDASSGYWQFVVNTKAYSDGSASVAPTAFDLAGNDRGQAATTFVIDNNPPTLSLTGPANNTFLAGNAVSVSATASDLAGCLTVRYKIDGGPWTAMALAAGSYTAAWDSTAVTEGAHTITVRATDGAGHNTDQTVDVIVDNTGPTCSLVSPQPGQYVNGKFTFRVSAWDANGIREVNLTIEGIGTFIMAYNSADGLYEMELDTTLFGDAAFSVSVNITDNGAFFGLRAPTRLTLASPGFHIDNVAPTLEVQSPTNMAPVKGPVNLMVASFDAPTAPSVSYSVDGILWTEMISSDGFVWTAAWNSTDVLDGTHTISFRSAGHLGHLSTATLAVVVDNNAPRAFWGAPDELSFLSGIFTIKVNAVDEVGIRSVTLDADGTDYPMTLNTGTGYYEYPLDTTAMQDGDLELIVTVAETSGMNPDNVTVRHVRIDNGYPVLSVISPVQGEVVSGLYEFNLTASDAYLDRVEYRVDSLGWVKANSSWDTSRHPDGPHTITFRAVDMMGRITEMALGLTIDNSFPTCAFIAPNNGTFVAGMVILQVRAVDAAGLTEVRLNGTGAEPLSYNPVSGLYEAQLDTQPLSDGTYMFRAECTDLAGRTAFSLLQLKVDNAAPELAVQSPEDMAYLSGTLAILATAPDAFDTVQEYQVDNLGWRPVDRTLDTSLLADGPHALSVRATDESGKSSVVQLTVYIDNSPPLVSVLTPSADGVAMTGEFVLRVAVGESEGLRTMSYSVDNGPSMPLLMNRATGYYEQSIQTSTLTDVINHGITIKVTSKAGLTTNLTRQFKVDNTPPAITVRSPSNAAQTGQVTISVDVKDATGISSVQARIDGGSWKDMMVSKTSGRYELKWQTGVPQNGYHNFEIRVEDTLGNKATSAYYFKVENPDYGWLVLVFLVALIVVVGAALAIRGRRKRPEDMLPPQEPEPQPAPEAAKEFPAIRPVTDAEEAPPTAEPVLNGQNAEDESNPGELDQGRGASQARAQTPLEELTESLRKK